MGLTDLLIRKLKPPTSGQKTHFDDHLPGFGIRISQGGTKSYVLKYGRDRRLKTLGRYPDLSLPEARKEAKRLQGQLLSRPLRSGQLPNVSFDDARSQFLADSAKRTKPSTYDEYARLLHKHFSFNKPLGELSRHDIMAAVSALRQKPSIEQHAYVAIRTMMNWCVRQGILDISPVPPIRYATKSRDRVLSDDELKVVWDRAIEIGYPYGHIVRLLILTGQRRGEVAGLRRSWIEDDIVVFPAGFTKNKLEHRLPLSPTALDVIASVFETKSDLLFPARGIDDRPFSGWGKAKKQFDEPLQIAPYTLHDLRRTFSSNLARLGTPIHVTEKLLNHISGTVSGVAAVYNRYSYIAEMREAIRRHDGEVGRIVAADQSVDGSDKSQTLLETEF